MNRARLGGFFGLGTAPTFVTRRFVRSFWRTMVRDTLGGDVLAAYDYLRARMGTDRPIGVIGASCGGAQAVQLAAVRPVATLSLFSSATSGSTTDTYRALPPTPTLFITSEQERGRI